MTKCICGHDEAVHNGPIGDCTARCLCELCPDDTRNDCWCAGFRYVVSVPEPSGEVCERPSIQELLDDGWVQLGALDVDGESGDQQ